MVIIREPNIEDNWRMTNACLIIPGTKKNTGRHCTHKLNLLKDRIPWEKAATFFSRRDANIFRTQDYLGKNYFLWSYPAFDLRRKVGQLANALINIV